MLYDVILFILGIFTGGTAAIVGFGIGSFLTPILSFEVSFGAAVAAVGIAHFFGTTVRFWLLRREVNFEVLVRFGILSVAGGLAGALLQGWIDSASLAIIFGGLMIVAGLSNLFEWSKRLTVKSSVGWALGVLSGFLGGLVGNQGGLRAAGLVNFKLGQVEFVATATAIALAVDLFRVPIYITTRGAELSELIPEIAIMSSGVIAGTLLCAPLLRRLPKKHFNKALSTALIVVGILVAARI